jgi:hypothetical protein
MCSPKLKPHATRMYRLVDKYMRQPVWWERAEHLYIYAYMYICIYVYMYICIYVYIYCLSSDVASIVFTYFSNGAHLTLKYGIQFFKINIPQNLLQALKKLVLVSQLNPFEFSLTVRNK